MSLSVHNPVPLDPIEWVSRVCFRERSSTYIARHEYTVHPKVFDGKSYPELPKYVEQLFRHLVRMVGTPLPERDSSASSSMPIFTVPVSVHSDLIEMADKSNYHGKGKEQHKTVQDYLRAYDPTIIAIEAPVFDDKINGFCDGIRLLGEGEETIIQIIDFKPQAAKEKRAGSQLQYYKNMLMHCAGINGSKIETIYFDDTHAFKLSNNLSI